MIHGDQVVADVIRQLVVSILAVLIARDVGIQVVAGVRDVEAEFDEVRTLGNRERVGALVTLLIRIGSAIQVVRRSQIKVHASVVAPPLPNPQELMSACGARPNAETGSPGSDGVGFSNSKSRV